MRERIIFVIPWMASFLKSDIEILTSEYEVVVNRYTWLNKKLTVFYAFRQFFFLLNNLWGTKAIVVSFGGYWALIPSLLGKITGIPVYIILNGMDCASITSIGYGILRKPILRFVCNCSYKWAYQLLPVSSSLIYNENSYYCHDKPNDFKQGYGHYFPPLINKGIVIYNGMDTCFWKKNNIIKKELTFLTVQSPGQFFLKGGDLIMKVARDFPHCTFFFAGIDRPKSEDKLNNVIFLGRLKAKNLRELYSKCQYYLQLSIIEGFGCALCEAMLCECVPIGSAVNMIPEIIGDSGYILNKSDPFQLKKLIKHAISGKNQEELGHRARKRVMDNYSMEKRKASLLEELK